MSEFEHVEPPTEQMAAPAPATATAGYQAFEPPPAASATAPGMVPPAAVPYAGYQYAAAPPAPPQPPAYPGAPIGGPSGKSNTGLWAAIVGGVLALIAIAIAVILVLSGGSSSNTSSTTTSYTASVTRAIAPVIADNSSLSSELASLSGSNTQSAQAAVSEAQTAVTSAQSALQSLTVPAGSEHLAQAVGTALTQEQGYLSAVGAVLGGPNSTNVGNLTPMATNVQAAFVGIGSVAPNGSQINNTSALISWGNGQIKAAARKTTTPAPSTTTNAQNVTPTPPSPYAGTKPCGGGLYAGNDTSCEFAVNVQQAWSQNSETTGPMTVYSPVTGDSYTMTCNPYGTGGYCTGGNDASVWWN